MRITLDVIFTYAAYLSSSSSSTVSRRIGMLNNHGTSVNFHRTVTQVHRVNCTLRGPQRDLHVRDVNNEVVYSMLACRVKVR